MNAEKTEVAVKIGHALAALHNVGVIHGDPTTSNMMLDVAGHVVRRSRRACLVVLH